MKSSFVATLSVAVVALSGCARTSELASTGVASPQTPTIFGPGVISDARWQWRITFTQDGNTAYYTASEGFFPATRKGTIMVSKRGSDGTWSAPQVAPFSGVHSDIDPYISPDGQRMYFCSIRPLNGAAKADLDVFVMQRTAQGWSEPLRLGTEVNSSLDELYPSQSASGTLYFASGPLGPTAEVDWNIYSADSRGSGFAARVPLSVLNTDLPFDPRDPTKDWEFNPEISRDGNTLIFTSLRPGGYGYGDLYFSRKKDGAWTAPENLGPAVNTAADEFHPSLGRDGRTLYFARTIFQPSLTPSDFYSIDLNATRVRQ